MTREFLQSLSEDKEFFLHILDHLIAEQGISLSLSVTDRCCSGCLHCLTSARPDGSSAPLELLEEIDGRYFQQGEIGFYSRGEPLDYKRDDEDLASVAEIFYSRGVKSIGFLTSGLLPQDLTRLNVLKKLITLQKAKGISFDPELSFHLYWPVSSEEEVVYIAKERLKYSLLLLLEMSPEIYVHLRGDLESPFGNIITTLNTYFEALDELGFKESPCGSCPNPCYGATICRTNGSAVLRASMLVTQPFGRWKDTLEYEAISLLSEAEQRELLEAIEVQNKEPLLTPGSKRWIDSNSLNSFYARTSGDIDINYSVGAEGMPRRIANIFEQSYEEVIAVWGDYLWDHFFSPVGRNETEILEQRGTFILFEK